MQVRLKKDCTYLTHNLEGLHVHDVKELAGVKVLQYTVRLDSDDETDNCSSDGPYLRENIVLDKDCNPIQTAFAHNFKYASFISDNFKILVDYHSVFDNAATHNFLSSATVYSKTMKIEKKHNRLISMMMPS